MKKLLLNSAIALLFLPALFQPPAWAGKKAVQCAHPRTNGEGLSDADVELIRSQVGHMTLESLINFKKPPCILRSDRMEYGKHGEMIFAYASTWRTDRIYQVTIRDGYVKAFRVAMLRQGDLKDPNPDPSLSTGNRI